MENAVVQQIRQRITRSKFGEIFFVSSFPKYDVEYVTKLLAIFEKEGLITRIAKGVYVKARQIDEAAAEKDWWVTAVLYALFHIYRIVKLTYLG